MGAYVNHRNEYRVIPGEINMKNGRPLQISLIIGICVGGVRIGYQTSTNICCWYCMASEIRAVKFASF